MICPNCNSEVSDGISFCEYCGSRLVPEDAVQPQPEPTAAIVTPLDQSSEGVDVFVTEPPVQQQEQSFGAYDATQQQAYGYDATQQQAYGYDATQQQPYGYEQGQQQAYDATYQQPYGYDQNQQQYAYDATQQQPYGGQAGYQAPQGDPYAQPYGYAQPPMSTMPTQQVSKAPFVLSIVALVLAVLGFFPVSIVLAIIALVMNSGQKKRGEVSTKQTPTTVMSVISLVLSVLMGILTVIIGGAIWTAAVNGELDSYLSSSSSSSSTTSTIATSGTSSSDPVGTWTLDSFVSDSTEYTSEDLAQMRELGFEANIVLNKDGSFEMDIFGATASGTWTDKGGGTIELSMYGDEMDMNLSGNELILVDDKDQYVFVRKS